MAKETKPAPVEERKGLFGVYDDVKDLVTNEIGRFKLEAGNNRIRVLTQPIPVPKHWDLPESADGKVINCLRFWGHRASEMGDPKKRKEILDSLPECPWCKLEEEYGNAKLGKDKGFYNRQFTHVIGVLHNGKSLLWDVSQKSVMDKLGRFEKDPDWAEFMPNGLQDLEIIVTKTEKKTGPTEYGVGAAPKSEMLSEEAFKDALDALPNILELVKPLDPSTPEGEAEIAELLRKNGAPVKGDKPKSF